MIAEIDTPATPETLEATIRWRLNKVLTGVPFQGDIILDATGKIIDEALRQAFPGEVGEYPWKAECQFVDGVLQVDFSFTPRRLK